MDYIHMDFVICNISADLASAWVRRKHGLPSWPTIMAYLKVKIVVSLYL